MRSVFLGLIVVAGIGVGSSAKAQTAACVSYPDINVLAISADDGRGNSTDVYASMATVQGNAEFLGANMGPTYELWTYKLGAVSVAGGFWKMKTDTNTGLDAYKFGKFTCYSDAGSADTLTAYAFICLLNNIPTPCDIQ